MLADDLREDNGEGVISSKSITITHDGNMDAKQPFMLSVGNNTEISVTVKTEDAKPGVYKGTITVIAQNATNKQIPVKIEISQDTIYALALNFVGVFVGLVFVVLGIALSNQKELLRQNKSSTVKGELIRLWTTKANELDKNARKVGGFTVVLIVLGIITYVAFYPKLVAFGANPVFDYATAFLFGFFQVGSSKITADMIKGKE